MHSRRMRTSHSSGCPGWSPPGTPLGAETPPDQALLWEQTPPRADPQTRHPQTRHPPDQAPPLGADPPPWEQAPPTVRHAEIVAPLLQGMLGYHLQCMLG